MPDKPIFVIAGFSSYQNKGDAALAICTFRDIQRFYPDAQVIPISDTPKLDSQKFGIKFYSMLFDPIQEQATISMEGKEVRPPRIRTMSVIYSIYKNLAFWLSILIFPFARHMLSEKKKEVVEYIKHSKALIFSPGGYILAPSFTHTFWLRHFFPIFVAKYFGKPVILHACSLGPFHGVYNRWLAQYFLNKVDVILLRENLSLELIHEIGVTKPRVEVTADAAFQLSPSAVSLDTYVPKSMDSEIRVGVALMPYYFPEYQDGYKEFIRYRNHITQALDTITEQPNVQLIFFIHCALESNNDTVFTRTVVGNMKNKNKAVIMDSDIHPSDLAAMYKDLDVMIGSRMHANILSLKVGTPVVAIEYEPKSTGILTTFNLQDAVVTIRNFSAELLVEKVNHVVSHKREYKHKIQQSLPHVMDESKRSMEIIHGYLEKSHN